MIYGGSCWCGWVWNDDDDVMMCLEVLSSAASGGAGERREGCGKGGL